MRRRRKVGVAQLVVFQTCSDVVNGVVAREWHRRNAARSDFVALEILQLLWRWAQSVNDFVIGRVWLRHGARGLGEIKVAEKDRGQLAQFTQVESFDGETKAIAHCSRG